MSALCNGQTLLHYRILEKIGQGGMGEVYKAEDTKLGRKVAIKVLLSEARQDERARRRLLLEARSVSALNHPNIVTIHAIEQADGLDFFVMEYVAGESLSARLQRGVLAFSQLLDFGMQTADALASAHALSLLHRDIKPSNILLTPRDQVKVLDFGLAKMTALTDELETMAGVLTGEGVILGTVAYMSPEQTRGATLDPRSDLFSLGSVLYEAATGNMPFRGASVIEIMHQITTVEPPAPSAVRPDLPREFDLVLARALAKNKEERYSSAAELGEALKALRGGGAAAAVEPETEAFVGRDPETKMLEALLQRAIQGFGNTVFITGEPGVGKTALATHFLHRARQSQPGILIARGRCVEQFGAGEAYLPFLDALGALLRGPDRERVMAALRSQAPTWCLQFPGAFASTGDVARLQRETIGATKERMLREMGDALGALSARSPVALFLEDLHWADPSSADLLRHLSQRAAEQRLLLIGTLRPEDIEAAGHPLKNCKREMHAHKLCEEIALTLLSQAHLAAYLDARFAPNNFPAELPALIYRKTEGHALFATGLVEFLAERGAIAKTDGRWTLVRPLTEADLEIPESVRGMIGRKIDALEEEDRRALQYASVEGEEFTSTVLAALLGADELELEERLDRLEKAHRLIRTIGEEQLPDGSVGTRYYFVHALYQNAFYSALLPKRRALLHKQAGNEILRRYERQAPRIAAQLATHFEQGRDLPRAVDYLAQAGDNARGLYDNAVAVEHYGRALGLLEHLPPEERASREMALYHKRGTAHLVLTRFAEAESDFTVMLRRARAIGDFVSECKALIALAGVFFWAHRLDEMGARSEEGLRVAEQIGNEALRTECMAKLGTKHQAIGDLELERAVLDEAIPLARSLGHSPALVPALTYRGVLHFFQTEYDMAEKLLQEGSRLASEARDGLHLTHCLFFLGVTQANQGRISEALATIGEATEMSRRNGNRVTLAKLPNSAGWIYRELGDLDQSLEHDRESADSSHELRVLEAETNALINLAQDYMGRGDPDKTLSALQQVEAICGRDPWHAWRFYGIRFQAAAAEYWLWQGQLERAAEHAGRLLANATQHQARKYMAEAHLIRAEIAARTGELPASEKEIEAGIETLRNYPAPLIAWKLHGALGRLRARDGRPEPAREAFAEAARIVQQIAASVTDDGLKATFLNSAKVREILEGAK